MTDFTLKRIFPCSIFKGLFKINHDKHQVMASYFGEDTMKHDITLKKSRKKVIYLISLRGPFLLGPQYSSLILLCKVLQEQPYLRKNYLKRVEILERLFFFKPWYNFNFVFSAILFSTKILFYSNNQHSNTFSNICTYPKRTTTTKHTHTMKTFSRWV